MTIQAVALVTGTGISGNGTDQNYVLQPASLENLIAQIGKHNILEQEEQKEPSAIKVKVRGWKTLSDVKLPDDKQIEILDNAIVAEQESADNAYQKTLETTKADALATLGPAVYAALEQTIVSGIPKPQVVDTHFDENLWLFATTTNPVLLALI